MRRLLAVVLIAGATALVAPAVAAPPTPKARAFEYISISYGQREMGRFLNRKFDIVRGPYFSNCYKPSSNSVRCDIDFRAGVFARCARGTVTNRGGYDYISIRAPIC